MGKNSFWSRPRGPLLLGLAACAACCAAPIAAIMIGAAAASTLAAIAEPVAGILLGGASVLAISIYVRRRLAAGSAACVVDGSCGCGPTSRKTLYSSPEPTADSPIACTADLRNTGPIQAGIDAYRRAFTHLVSTERTKNGFRWRFRNSPGVEAHLEALSRAEHTCCAFMKFEVTATADEVIWETRGNTTAQRAIEEYMLMPDRLREEVRSGHDVVHLKESALRVGMVFTSDTSR